MFRQCGFAFLPTLTFIVLRPVVGISRLLQKGRLEPW